MNNDALVDVGSVARLARLAVKSVIDLEDPQCTKPRNLAYSKPSSILGNRGLPYALHT